MERSVGGSPPAAKSIKATKDQQACGDSIPDESLVVGSDKGLKNAVVRITDIKKGKKWEAKSVLDQKKCHFVPHVTVAQTGADVEILNSDVLIASSWLTGWRQQWDRIASPDQLLETMRLAQRLHAELPAERVLEYVDTPETPTSESSL